MARIEWAKSAVDDLDNIVQYIARDSVYYAQLLEASIIQQVFDRIGRYPESGAVVPEFNDVGIREILHDTYRVIYALKDDVCIVVAIVHGSRELKKHHWRPA